MKCKGDGARACQFLLVVKESAKSRSAVLVGRTVTVRLQQPEPPYFTPAHRRWVGQAGRVHAVVPAQPRENPLVKVGFGEPKTIVFYRLADLDVERDSELENPPKHGRRGSHLPKAV